MTDKFSLPPISAELLDELIKRFPDAIPQSPHITEADFRVLQGNQQVIWLLKYHYNIQNNEIRYNTKY